LGRVGQGRREEAASPAETLRSHRRARKRHGAARPGLPRGEEVGGPNEHSQERGKCPPSVKIIDEAKVPAEYKHITVTLRLPQWQDLLAGRERRFGKLFLSGIRKQETSVELEAIKQALNLEKAVEGADLVLNRSNCRWSERFAESS